MFEKSRNPLDVDLWLCINFKQNITIPIKQSIHRDTTILCEKTKIGAHPIVIKKKSRAKVTK